jgi:hypothetical protein
MKTATANSRREKQRARGVGVDGCIVDLDKMVVPWPNEKKISDGYWKRASIELEVF